MRTFVLSLHQLVTCGYHSFNCYTLDIMFKLIKRKYIINIQDLRALYCHC